VTGGNTDYDMPLNLTSISVSPMISLYSWYKNEGIYYSIYDKPEGSEPSAKMDQHKLYYHMIGAKQSQEVLVYNLFN